MGEFEGNVRNVIAVLEGKYVLYPKYTRLWIEVDWDYDSCDFTLWGERLETEEEVAKRLVREAKAAERNIKRAKAALQKKMEREALEAQEAASREQEEKELLKALLLKYPSVIAG